jgi:hypothetical protein
MAIPQGKLAVRPQTHREFPWDHASHARSRSKTHRGHCRASGVCARLRIIEEANATVEPVYDSGAHRADFPLRIALLQREDTKCPRGHNASRARPIACAPIRILLPALADPKARFCRSLASRSPTVNEKLSLSPSKLLTQRHLATTPTSPPMGLHLPPPAHTSVPVHNSQDAPAKSSPFS